MNKKEYMKCKEFMYTAIQKTRQANEEYSEAEMMCNNRVTRQTFLRKADQHYGEAMGINQVLVALRFKHEDMKILSKEIYD